VPRVEANMSAMQRRKGAAWEREVATMLRDAMPGCDAKRGLGQARSAHEVADVDVPGFWVECKRGAQPNVRAALRQAKEAREASGRALTHHAVAIVRDDRQDAFVAMPLGDFLELVREWWERGQR